MTPQDKQLLLKELSARLPYGVKVEVNGVIANPLGCELIGVLGKAEMVYVHLIPAPIPIEEVKPYLRPLSSMTEEEYDQLYIDSRVKEDSVDILDALANDMDAIDWLRSHHFDYRELIEKGLALEAPEGMYKIEEL